MEGKIGGRFGVKKGGMPPIPRKLLALFLIWRLKQKPQHGYSLISEIRGLDVSPSKPSTIYLLLSNLERAGFIKSSVDEHALRMRKIYSTTQKGWDIYLNLKKKRMHGLFLEFVRSLAK